MEADLDRLGRMLFAARDSADLRKSRQVQDCVLEVERLKAMLRSGMDAPKDGWLFELDRSLEKQSSLSVLFSSKVTVYVVPKHLKRICPVYYEPEQFRFGLHNRFLRYEGIERMKVDVAREFMSWKGMGSVLQWKEFTRLIVRDAEEARHCYEVPDVRLVKHSMASDQAREGLFGLEPDEVVRNVLTMDSLFLVVFLQAVVGKCKFPSFRQGIVKRGLLHLVVNFYKDVALLENQVPMYLLRAILRAFRPDFKVMSLPPTPDSSTRGGPQRGSANSSIRAGADLGRPFEEGEADTAEQLDDILRVAVKLVYPFIEPSPSHGGSSNVSKTGSRFLKNFCDVHRSDLEQSPHIFDYIYQVTSGDTSHREVEDDDLALDMDDLALDMDDLRKLTVGQGDSKWQGKHRRLASTKVTSWVPGEEGVQKVERLFSKLANLPRASDLQRVGITFKPTENPSLTAVNYDKRTKALYLPRLEFYDYTAALFRNLATYEQLSRPPNHSQLLSYLQFMDYLIDTQDDVAVLTKSDVLKNNVGSDKILVESWNTIRIGLTYTEMTGNWRIIHDAINEHCSVKWHWWKVELWSTYFSRPWYVVSFIIFVIVTIATLIQTVVALVQL